jgi:AbrB family looped-hinge helix DNA binding protein
VIGNDIGNGRMAFMNAIAEIDKAGRLVVPKKMRDALHLVPGTRVLLQQEGDAITMQPEARPRGLYLKNGIPVYDVGLMVPLEAIDWVQLDRDARAEELMGEWLKP